jgi:phosphohistidine phosphatase SixA
MVTQLAAEQHLDWNRRLSRQGFTESLQAADSVARQRCRLLPACYASDPAL